MYIEEAEKEVIVRAEVLEADEKDMESGEEALLVPALPVRTRLGGAWPGNDEMARRFASSSALYVFHIH